MKRFQRLSLCSVKAAREFVNYEAERLRKKAVVSVGKYHPGIYVKSLRRPRNTIAGITGQDLNSQPSEYSRSMPAT
jgi:hypothetical protein